MLFTSGLFFFIYLPIVLLGFYFIARVMGQKPATIWLGLASLFFYGYWSPIYIILLLSSIIGNYFVGLLIVRSRGKASSAWITGFFVSLNLFLLFYFKYYNFFVNSAGLGLIGFPVLNVVLPIGISFFTFTQIAYLVDVHRGKVDEADFFHYVLFVSYFPHLIAGPILHHQEMMPQFAAAQTYRLNVPSIVVGLSYLAIGMIKKVVIADSISPFADAAFTAAGAGNIDCLGAWYGAICYTLQLYFDFSGYSDMAIGLSYLFNIKLPFNFNSPYKSRSITEFWRRWHLTLSRFLRDYLYFTLGGNRSGAVRRYLNLLITMLLGGMWHGAAWTFVIWGGLHGLYLMINHSWRWVEEKLGLTAITATWPGRAASWLITMVAVIIGWVFFRASSVPEALTMLSAMFAPAGAAPASNLHASDWFVPFALIAVCVGLPNSQQWVEPLFDHLRSPDRSWLLRNSRGFYIGATSAFCTLLVLIAASRTESAFIYFNF